MLFAAWYGLALTKESYLKAFSIWCKSTMYPVGMNYSKLVAFYVIESNLATFFTSASTGFVLVALVPVFVYLAFFFAFFAILSHS